MLFEGSLLYLKEDGNPVFTEGSSLIPKVDDYPVFTEGSLLWQSNVH